MCPGAVTSWPNLILMRSSTCDSVSDFMTDYWTYIKKVGSVFDWKPQKPEKICSSRSPLLNSKIDYRKEFIYYNKCSVRSGNIVFAHVDTLAKPSSRLKNLKTLTSCKTRQNHDLRPLFPTGQLGQIQYCLSVPALATTATKTAKNAVLLII